MRKTMWSILAVLAVLSCTSWARAEDPKPTQPKPEQPKKENVDDRQQRRKDAFDVAATNKDFDKALSILDEMLADKEINDEDRYLATFAEFQILIEKKGDGAKACPLAKNLAEMKKNDSEILNALAWTILDTPKVKNRDFDVALSIAKQAAEVNKYVDPAILDTLARAYFEKNDLDKAIEFQTKAVEKTKAYDALPAEMKAEMKDTLEKYKAKKQAPKTEKKPQ
jgi:tetratricopeptide (TPR) repeat protein